MKLNEVALANALAILMAILYIACALLVALLPEFSKAVFGSWFHGIDITSIWTGAPRGNFVLGGVSAVLVSWGGGWLFARIYNQLAK